MESNRIAESIDRVYAQRIAEKGATPQGVFWNGEASQRLRFEQLSRLFEPETAFSILDYGCGYGALLDYLRPLGTGLDYTGFDICAAMVAEARKTFPAASFTADEVELGEYDYVVESGIFNLRLETPEAEWRAYVLDVLDRMVRRSRKGIAANFLTTYKDIEYVRNDHYYADPCFLFDYCKRRYSRQVALLHDYDLYEFTILVKKPAGEPWTFQG